MYKYLLSLTFLSFHCFAQVPSVQWEYKYGGTQMEYPSKVMKAQGGGYLVTLTSGSRDGDISHGLGQTDMWLVKLNDAGQLQWEHSYGSPGWDFDPAVIATPEGGYMLSGFRRDTDPSANNTLSDIALMKLDSQGAVQWAKYFNYDWVYDIQIAPDGGYVLAGYDFTDPNHVTSGSFLTDAWLLKLDSDGNEQWKKYYGGTGRDEFNKILVADGGYVLAGSTSSVDGDVTGNHGSTDFWVLHVDLLGNTVWEKTYGGSSYDTFSTIKATLDGGYIAIGSVNSHDGDVTTPYVHLPGITDCWVIKIDANGGIQWTKAYGGSNNANGNDIIEVAQGGYAMAAATTSTDGDVTGAEPSNGNEAWLVRLDSNGAILWQKLMGDNGQDTASSVLQTDDNGFLVTGTHATYVGQHYNMWNTNLWVVKLGSETLSNPSFSGITASLWPNPVSSILNLQLPAGITVDQTIVTDVTGKKVAMYTGATHAINFDALAPGIYFVALYTSNGREVHKVIRQ